MKFKPGDKVEYLVDFNRRYRCVGEGIIKQKISNRIYEIVVTDVHISDTSSYDFGSTVHINVDYLTKVKDKTKWHEKLLMSM